MKEFIPPPPKRRRRVRGKREKKEEGDRQGQPDLVASSFNPGKATVLNPSRMSIG